MANTPKDPFKGLILDEEEQAIEDSVEELVDERNFKDNKKLIEKAAQQYVELNNSKPITLRVRQTDLIKIKSKAKRSNIPYQTLIGAVLHDFAESKKEIRIR